jgi:hypothetical protein
MNLKKGPSLGVIEAIMFCGDSLCKFCLPILKVAKPTGVTEWSTFGTVIEELLVKHPFLTFSKMGK